MWSKVSSKASVPAPQSQAGGDQPVPTQMRPLTGNLTHPVIC